MNNVDIKRVDNRLERQICIGAIVSDQFLRDISSVYNPNLMVSAYARVIVTWCVEYFRNYNEAPKKAIQDIFNRKRRDSEIDEDSAEIVAALLDTVSKEYQTDDLGINAPYLSDQAMSHFKRQSVAKLREELQTCLINNDIPAAEASIARYREVKKVLVEGFDPYTDTDGIYDAFERTPEPLFEYPGAYGRMVNDQFVRGGFIGVMGAFKRGKTFMLIDMAHMAHRARCNVAFFEAGDMNKPQIQLRTAIHLAGKSNLAKYCGEVICPVLDCKKNQNGTCPFKREREPPPLPPAPDKWNGDPLVRLASAPKGYFPCKRCEKDKECAHEFEGTMWWSIMDIKKPLTAKEACLLGSKFRSHGEGKHFRMVTTAARTTSVKDICGILDTWNDFEGWSPDVIFIDYADLLAPLDSRQEVRHQHNDTWMAMRAMAQERHALVVTATQVNAKALTVETMNLGHFSEDNRKYAHVTGMLALNQTDVEKRKGLMRIGWLLLREGEFEQGRDVNVLQCLKRGKPFLGSFE